MPPAACFSSSAKGLRDTCVCAWPVEACGEGCELFELGDREAEGGGAALISHQHPQQQVYALPPHCPSFPTLIAYECVCASVCTQTDGAMKKMCWKAAAAAAASALLLLSGCGESASSDSATALPRPVLVLFLSAAGPDGCMMTLSAARVRMREAAAEKGKGERRVAERKTKKRPVNRPDQPH